MKLMDEDMNQLIQSYLDGHAQAVKTLQDSLQPAIERFAQIIIETLQCGQKVLILGNGGSAADAQHFAAELVGRFVTERPALPAIALTTDTSLLTAVGNDYGFEEIFRRQIQALASPGDVVLAISTSGASINVLRAIQQARFQSCRTLALLGKDGGEVLDHVDLALVVPSETTAHIQEMHILVLHLVCQLIDADWADGNLGRAQ